MGLHHDAPVDFLVINGIVSSLHFQCNMYILLYCILYRDYRVYFVKYFYYYILTETPNNFEG